MKDKAKKTEPNSPLRVPKLKKPLGLRIPTIAMPHEDLIQPEKPPPKDDSDGANDREKGLRIVAENDADLPSNQASEIWISKSPIWISKNDEKDEKKDDLDIQIENLDIQKNQKDHKKERWKRYDKNRSTASLFIRAAEELVNEIRHFNVKNDLDMREFFELSARALMDSFGYPKKKVWISLDDRLTIFKTRDSIIGLFCAYNRILNFDSDWKPKDDAVGVNYNEVDWRIIEIGIITTQSNLIENGSDTKISRFKYYTREIDKIIALNFGEETLAVMIGSYRKRWREITGREVDLEFLKANDEK